MKKIIFFIAILSIWVLSSCGTTSYQASEYEDGIYYTPDKSLRSAMIKDQQDLENLSLATQSRGKSGSITETIYLSKDMNHVEIAHSPNSSYIVLLDGESYEDRLNKFNDSTYSFSISFALEDPYAYNSWNNPWWGGRYGPYSNSWYGWGGSNFGMSFGYGYGYGYGYGWGGGWYDPWYSGWYGYGSPWYPYPPMYYPSYGIGRKDIYYGKRNTHNRGRNIASSARGGTSRPRSLNQIRGTSSTGDRIYSSSTGRRTVSSSSGINSTRRGVSTGGNNTAIYNNPGIKPSGNSSRPNSSAGTKYRRSANSIPASSSATSTNRNSSYSRSAVQNNNSQSTSNRSTYSSSSTNRSSSSSSSSSRSSSGRSSGSGRR